MVQSKQTSKRNAIVKDLVYLIIAGSLFAICAFAWSHFHRESSSRKDLQAQEREQSLTDH